MAELTFTFDRAKAIEAILFLARKLRNPGRHNITHLLYFADKTSLERHGRFICGDDYYAMEFGPVPTNVYNLIKQAEQTDELGFRSEGRRIIALRDPDLDLLSDSDIECLAQAVKANGDLPFWKIMEESHDEAYKAAWESRGDKGSMRMTIESIAAQLQDSEELLNHLANIHST